MIKFKDILEARKRIKNSVYKTQLKKSRYLSDEDKKYFLKIESQQKTNSFKIRGALNKLKSLTEAEKEQGVMSISSGNHGAAVSYASKILGGINATIFVPKGTPQAKIEKMDNYGAKVKVAGDDYNEAHKIAMKYLKKNNLTFIDPCSDKEVIAGQGTIALEMIEEIPDLRAILVPVGGGGMITGISVAAKTLVEDIKIIGLQTEACPAMIASVKENKFHEEYPIDESICDALIGGVGRIPFEMSSKCIDDLIEVKEKTIKEAFPLAISQEKIMLEPSSAIGYAGVMDNPDLIKKGNIAIVISGGNVDGNTIKELFVNHY